MNREQIQRIIKIGLPTVLAVIITYFLLKEIDPQQIPQTLSRLSIKALFIGFTCYCLLVLAKTLRFRALLNLDSSLHQVFPILALHTFWGNILPMRTGDVSYVYLMQRRQKVDATQGIASLLVAESDGPNIAYRLGGCNCVVPACRASRNVFWYYPFISCLFW